MAVSLGIRYLQLVVPLIIPQKAGVYRPQDSILVCHGFKDFGQLRPNALPLLPRQCTSDLIGVLPRHACQDLVTNSTAGIRHPFFLFAPNILQEPWSMADAMNQVDQISFEVDVLVGNSLSLLHIVYQRKVLRVQPVGASLAHGVKCVEHIRLCIDILACDFQHYRCI